MSDLGLFAAPGNEKVPTSSAEPHLPLFEAPGNKQPAKRIDDDPAPPAPRCC